MCFVFIFSERISQQCEQLVGVGWNNGCVCVENIMLLPVTWSCSYFSSSKQRKTECMSNHTKIKLNRCEFGNDLNETGKQN